MTFHASHTHIFRGTHSGRCYWYICIINRTTVTHPKHPPPSHLFLRPKCPRTKRYRSTRLSSRTQINFGKQSIPVMDSRNKQNTSIPQLRNTLSTDLWCVIKQRASRRSRWVVRFFGCVLTRFTRDHYIQFFTSSTAPRYRQFDDIIVDTARDGP